jgi:hypothetical protein
MSEHVSISPAEAADRLAIRELVEAYAHCADRRDAKGQMSLFTADTHFVVYMNAKDPTPSQELHSRETLAPVFAELNKYEATTPPHLLLSLIRQLTGPGRVPESSITAFDSSRFIPSYLYDKIHHEFPGVVLVDHIGGDGRVKAEFKPNAIPFSVENNNAKGLDTTVVEARLLN